MVRPRGAGVSLVPHMPPERAALHRTLTPDIKQGFRRGKQKSRTSMELCGLKCGAGAGITKMPIILMGASYLKDNLEKYRQKYLHFAKCLPLSCF